MSPTSIIFRRSSHRLSLSYPLFSFHICKCFSSASSQSLRPIQTDLSHPIYMIWGSNTGVGKTLVSAGLASSVLLSPSSQNRTKFNYIKPLQTGFPQDSDSRFVFRKVSEVFLRGNQSAGLLASNHVLWASATAADQLPGSGNGGEGLKDLCWCEERRIGGREEADVVELTCKTIYGWKEAISPHLAADKEGAVVEDPVLRESLQRFIGCHEGGWDFRSGDRIWTLVETAGGVASPGPSGTLQCDLYRLPAILVGDGQLGGISGTISAYESLTLRGYDVAAVLLEDRGLSNEEALSSYLRNRVPVLVLPCIPKDPQDDLIHWFNDSHKIFCSLQDIMLKAYLERMKRLHDMPKKAVNVLWWPFTQHNHVPKEIVTVIDSRSGENFAVHKVGGHQGSELLSEQFDACASWWTQGPDATLQIELAREMGYAAARFGHVMFPENVYEPALHCAELLLDGVGRGWASRTFFSDNGSTAIEIALKMAFRKFSFDHGILLDHLSENSLDRCFDFKVLALKGSYHGDTLGAMEAQAPSCYTGFLQQPWYSGRGLFLDPPTVFICNGDWMLSLPKVMQSDKPSSKEQTFCSCDDLFHGSRDPSYIAQIYSSYISQKLSHLSGSDASELVAALIVEPVIQGSGGMHFIDPLFQRVLVKECRSRKIPVIFDEVFTGFWRLGAESAAELLDCFPDIACFGKLMTGGMIPLSATLATDSVFNAFKGDSKLMALLHGHSYSAHAMGCTAACKAIRWFKDPLSNLNIIPEEWRLTELWDNKLVLQISYHPAVQRVVALGTLFAIELRAEGSNAGYASQYASSLVQKLRRDGIYVRPLGNVIYIMCGPCTSPQVCYQLLCKLYQRIDEFNQPSKESNTGNLHSDSIL